MAAEVGVTAPYGWRVELSTARVKPGMSSEVDKWMRMLRERQQECIATLKRDRMALEMVFRGRQHGEEVLHWVTIQSATAAPDADAVDESALTQIDRDHIAFSRRCKEAGWDEADLQVLLLPEPVRAAMTAWINSA